MTISILMANFRGAAYLEAAVRSVQRQTDQGWELLISDDCSDDGSAALIAELALGDDRIVPILSQERGGAAAARNRALAQARGEWIAIMDSDDVMHPARLARMRAAAQRRGAQMVADDLVHFSDAPDAAGRTLLEPLAPTGVTEVDAAALLTSEVPGSRLPSYGYLKPLIARAALDGLRYDESLSISEDFDFYLQILARGVTCHVLPDPMYLYRRHGGSLSYRLSVDALERMVAGNARSRAHVAGDAALVDLIDRRGRNLSRLLAYQRLVEDLKARRMGRAAGRLLTAPWLAGDLAQSLKGRRSREAGAAQARGRRSLSLGREGADVEVPAVPPPGGDWAEPPCRMAARLSAEDAANALTLSLSGADAVWASWMLPDPQVAEATGLPEALPDGIAVPGAG